MHLYKTSKGIYVKHQDLAYKLDQPWDLCVNQDDLHQYLLSAVKDMQAVAITEFEEALSTSLQAPIGSQELWAAGVTYLRSRDARMEESKKSGASDAYQLVYEADRPELFFKSLPQRVSAHQEPVHIRRDSTWNVPEPELTLMINSQGKIIGYTIGNDMSSRSIEGENPLYLPQAKSYERSASLGPCLYVPETPISFSTKISIRIVRHAALVFEGAIAIDRIKRKFEDLVGYLFRELDFPSGVMLMTGTGIVPGDEFTLQAGDEVSISIEGIGTLTNTVRYK